MSAQKKRPPTSTPCPITLHLQCSQTVAIACMAHFEAFECVPRSGGYLSAKRRAVQTSVLGYSGLLFASPQREVRMQRIGTLACSPIFVGRVGTGTPSISSLLTLQCFPDEESKIS